MKKEKLVINGKEYDLSLFIDVKPCSGNDVFEKNLKNIKSLNNLKKDLDNSFKNKKRYVNPEERIKELESRGIVLIKDLIRGLEHE